MTSCRMAGSSGYINVIDNLNRESLGMEVDFSLPSERVIRALEQVMEWRGRPLVIRWDNGPENINALIKWRVSAKGNSFLNLESYNFVVYPTKTGRWVYKIGDRFGPRKYPTNNEAKLALLDDFWMATQDDDRLWAYD